MGLSTEHRVQTRHGRWMSVIEAKPQEDLPPAEPSALAEKFPFIEIFLTVCFGSDAEVDLLIASVCYAEKRKQFGLSLAKVLATSSSENQTESNPNNLTPHTILPASVLLLSWACTKWNLSSLSSSAG
jgi:hypothetical protein